LLVAGTGRPEGPRVVPLCELVLVLVLMLDPEVDEPEPELVLEPGFDDPEVTVPVPLEVPLLVDPEWEPPFDPEPEEDSEPDPALEPVVLSKDGDPADTPPHPAIRAAATPKNEMRRAIIARVLPFLPKCGDIPNERRHGSRGMRAFMAAPAHVLFPRPSIFLIAMKRSTVHGSSNLFR
jgi:hypothetical protein